jgi:CspA family cold shock protein
MEGTIKKLIQDRGFGFIHGQNGQDIFFHRSSLLQLNFENLREGQMVEFELHRSDKGPRASNVRVNRV